MEEEMDRQQFQRAYGKIVAKAWADEAFKKRLISDPRIVLKENGIDAPEGVEFTVVESTRKRVYLVLPPVPESGIAGAEAIEDRLAALF
jgi:hypothetical protein